MSSPPRAASLPAGLAQPSLQTGQRSHVASVAMDLMY